MKPPANSSPAPAHIFTGYQKFVIAVLAFLQFTIMLDFMILSPLGAILLSKLHITTSQFGLVVSSYAIAAGISGILAAGFADRYDRKRLLLFFYAGFVLGTVLCGIAPNFHTLLFARIVTGVFGGVVGSVSLAIVADLFPVAVRGRVMGFIMSAFAGAQVLGIPIGILLATRLGWHAPFIMVAAVSLLVGGIVFARLLPIDAHLKIVVKRNPLEHLWETAKSPRYTGVCSLVLGPLLGRLSDRIGKYQMFCYATVVGIGVVLYYTHLGLSPFWMLVVISIILFGSISGRMVAAGALTSAIPNPADRGAYMSISSSLQQFAGGMASMIAGTIVVQSPEGKLLHYPLLGWVVSGAMFVAMLFMYRVHQLVTSDAKTKFQVGGNPELAATET